MRRAIRALALVMIAGLCNPASADTNLLPNGDFSNASQIGGWTLYVDVNVGTLGWNSDDADGAAGSGSIELDTDSIGEPTHADSACFRVPAGGAFSASAQAKVLVGVLGAMDFNFQFGCGIYDTPDCSGGGVASINIVMPQATTWTTPTTASGTLPDNAQSANCSIFEDNPYEASAASVIFDNLLFTADYVFHDGFE